MPNDKRGTYEYDLSEFIRPHVESDGRIIYKVFPTEDVDDTNDFVVVSINVVQLDSDLKNTKYL